ncbi:hypothetical protein JOE33_002693 [Pseudomonas sp. PvP027]|nr:hypothetical protein [Pseudomonas sp. PvP027]
MLKRYYNITAEELAPKSIRLVKLKNRFNYTLLKRTI